MSILIDEWVDIGLRTIEETSGKAALGRLLRYRVHPSTRRHCPVNGYRCLLTVGRRL